MKPSQVLLLLAAVSFGSAPLSVAQQNSAGHETRTIEGWSVHVSTGLLQREPAATAKALDLLASQLRQIVEVVPAPAVTRLRQVPLWFSEEYAGAIPNAAYHPDPRWLQEHHRNPAMAKGVEFTNIRIFEAECRRMPVFVLHELAHAYHDRVLGFQEERIKAAYEHALKSGAYDSVQRRDAQRRIFTGRAYALTNEREYFAESSEAFFGENDFFPFTRAELAKHDPGMFELLVKVWGTGNSAAVEAAAAGQ